MKNAYSYFKMFWTINAVVASILLITFLLTYFIFGIDRAEFIWTGPSYLIALLIAVPVYIKYMTKP